MTLRLVPEAVAAWIIPEFFAAAALLGVHLFRERARSHDVASCSRSCSCMELS